MREFRTGDYVWSFGSLDGKAKVADNRLVLEAPNTMGGAGMECKGGFTEHGDKIPELDLEILPGNQAKAIRLSMPDQADNEREWTFHLEGLEPGTRVRVAAKDGKPLDPAAIGEPDAKYDPASIKSVAFVGDWKPTPLAVAVHAVRLIPTTAELKAGQEAYIKGEREKRDREESRRHELEGKRRELLAGAPHPEDGPSVTDIDSAGANRIVVHLRDRESVSARQVPVQDLGEVEIREKKVENPPYAIEKGKPVPAVECEVLQQVLDEHPALRGVDPLPLLTSIFQYLLLPESKQNPNTAAAFRRQLVDLAEKSLRFGEGNAYGITMPAPLPLMGFVSYYSVPETILGPVLLRAHAVTGEERFLAGAVRAAQFTLGGNPMGTTLTTGQGHAGPQFPLHVDSQNTELAPPKGITVYGNTDLAGRAPDWVNQWFFRDTLYPASDKWPAAESYQDIFAWPEMNEYTVHQSIGPMAFYLGYLHARGQ